MRFKIEEVRKDYLVCHNEEFGFNPLSNWGLLKFFFFFLQLHLWHMEVPRRGVESELQLLAFATGIAMRDLSCTYNLCSSLWQCWILNPLSENRDRTHILTEATLGP